MINQVVPNSAPKIGAYKNFSQPKQGWYLSTDFLDNEDEQKQKKYGKAIVISSLAVGFGTLAIMKGVFPKNVTKLLRKFKLHLEKKINKGSRFTSFYKKTIGYINSYQEKAQSLNNLTSLKDILFQKLMFTTKITKRIHKGITGIFNNLSRKTVNSYYASTDRKLAGFNEHILSLNQKLLRKNDPKINELVEIVNSKLSAINKNMNANFGVSARTGRLERIEKETNELFDYMWNATYSDIKNFRSKNMYQTFMAEEKMLPFKKALNQELRNSRKEISSEMFRILKEYKKILPKNEYLRLRSQVVSVLKSLDSSIETESIKYVDKARDLKLGSAPTDVISILSGVGTVGWFLGKAEDKDKRISASIKYGIPAIGTIATSLYCTGRLAAGSKSLLISILSGLIMNRIGVQVDNWRKKYQLEIHEKPQSDKG